MREVCPFHTSEDVSGTRLSDGSYEFECDESDHPVPGPHRWLRVPPPLGLADMGGLASELALDIHLVGALRSLGPGWYEYGLVERAYARKRPDDFRIMVERWGHTAAWISPYTVSSYLGGTLGRLARHGSVHYRSGRGTGRWSYNSDASFWSLTGEDPWEERVRWVDVIGDASPAQQELDAECKAYVGGR